MFFISQNISQIIFKIIFQNDFKSRMVFHEHLVVVIWSEFDNPNSEVMRKIEGVDPTQKAKVDVCEPQKVWAILVLGEFLPK